MAGRKLKGKCLGVGGGWVMVCGCLTASSRPFRQQNCYSARTFTNKYIWGSNACRWKVSSDKIGWCGRGSDWFTIHNRFSHITLLLIALWQPLIDVWANICKSTLKQLHSYRLLVTAHEITTFSERIVKWRNRTPYKSKISTIFVSQLFCRIKAALQIQALDMRKSLVILTPYSELEASNTYQLLHCF